MNRLRSGRDLCASATPRFVSRKSPASTGRCRRIVVDQCIEHPCSDTLGKAMGSGCALVVCRHDAAYRGATGPLTVLHGWVRFRKANAGATGASPLETAGTGAGQDNHHETLE